ncbi:MAG: glycosyltransferase family 2 protein [Rikenellaceae bacterium]
MDFLYDIFSYLEHLTQGMTLEKLASIFWFLFFIEIPRYYLLDVFVLIRRFCYRGVRRQKEVVARIELYTKNPFVTIIVPGKDEGKNIYKLTESLREQTYRNFELVVVDDGSDDNTKLICESLEANGLIDRFYSVDERGGKASAANLALLNNKSDVIVHLDADSSLDKDALEQILIPFYYHDNVGAVGGCVKVRNADDTFCTLMQSMEYLESIQLGRTVTSELNLFRTISGAFGAFRTDVLNQIGYWDVGPGLDGDITQKVRKSGYKVVFNPKAICLTAVPTSFRKLYKQRLRWGKSLVRFRLRKHSNVLDFRYANFRIMNFLTNLDNLVFSLFFDTLWIFYMLNFLVDQPYGLLDLLVLKFLITIPLAVLSFLLSMSLSERWKEEFKMIIATPMQSLYSGYFLRITRIIASFKEFFFFSSYRDKWNPKKSSRVARDERL